MWTLHDLLGAAASQPDMRHAACVKHIDLFDQAITEPDAQQRCLQICATCPDLVQCRRWVASLDRDAVPLGVTAGSVVHSRNGWQRSPEPVLKPASDQRTAPKPAALVSSHGQRPGGAHKAARSAWKARQQPRRAS